MADTSIANLTAVTAALLAQEIPTNDSGTTRKFSLTQLLALLQPGDSEASPGTSVTTTSLVDTSISIPLEVGSYSLLGAGKYSSSVNGLALQFGCAADGGLVVSDFCLVETLFTSATAAQVAWTNSLGTRTFANNGGGATIRPFLLQGHIVVTTAGNLKLQISSESNGLSATMDEAVFQAFRVG